MKNRTLRRIFILPLYFKLLWLVPSAIIASLFFIGAYLANGAAGQAKQVSFNLYQGHAEIYSSGYRPTAPYDTNFWWQRPASMQQLSIQPFVRGYTRRSKLPIWLTADRQRLPMDLIVIEDSDRQVFPAFMTKDNPIPLNTVSIGVAASVKHNIKAGDIISIAIPVLDTVLTNLTVNYIYNVQDVYFQNYTVFIDKKTLEPIVGQAMQNYHVKFFASPFYSVQISNTQSLVPNSFFTAGTDGMEYALSVMEQLKNFFFTGLIWVAVLAGLLYAFAQYRYTAYTLEKFNAYRFTQGIPQPNMFLLYLADSFGAAITFGIMSGALSLLFDLLPFEYLIFSPYDGLFQSLSLKISQGIIPLVDYFFLVRGAGYCILFFTGSSLLCAIMMKIGEKLYGENGVGRLIIISIIAALFGYLGSISYLSFGYGLEARNNALKKYYFGEYSLQNIFYKEAMSLGLTPPVFTLSPNVKNRLDNDSIPYLLKLESKAEIFQLINVSDEIISTNRYATTLMSFRGRYTPELQTMIAKLESNQVLVGRRIDAAFPQTDLLNVKIYGLNSNITVSLPITERVNFDIPLYNDAIFINMDTLAAYMGAPLGSVSSILMDKEGKKQMLSLTNLNRVLQPFKQESLGRLGLERPLVLIKTIIFVFCLASVTALLSAFFYAASLRRREEYVYSLMWTKNKFVPRGYFVSALALMGGLIGAVLSLIGSLVIPQELPMYFRLESYIMPVSVYEVHWGFLVFSLLISLSILAAGYGVLSAALKTYYYVLLRNPEVWDFSKREF